MSIIKRTKRTPAKARERAVKPSRPTRNSTNAGQVDTRLASGARPRRTTALAGDPDAPVADRGRHARPNPGYDPSRLPPTPHPTVPQSANERVPIGDLRPDPSNARKHSEAQYELIAASILKFGFHGVIGIDDSNQIVFGHGRLEGARRAGMTHVPCERLSNLSAPECAALALADNRLAEHSTWDELNLTLKLQELWTNDLDFDPGITGFDTVYVDRLMGPESDPRQAKIDAEGYSQDPDDRAPVLQDEKPAISQPGDLWGLGRHKLLHGDALDPQSYPRLLGGEIAVQVVCDSPYNVPNRGHVSAKPFREFAIAHGEMSSNGFTRFLAHALGLASRAARDGAILHVFMNHGHMREVLAAAEEASLEVKNVCVWVKPSPGWAASIEASTSSCSS